VTPDAQATLTRRFLVLRATRWLPTGLLIPILVLLLVDRGLSLGQIGLAMAAQGVMVFVLELPTGGLADALGRRPVLMAGTIAEAVSMGVLLVADSVPLVVLVFGLQGLYRALESGPLDAWYVDAARDLDPDADIGRALATSGTVTGLAIAAGALVSGGLVALDPLADVNALALPVAVAAVLRVADLTAIAVLMREPSVLSERPTVAGSLRSVPSVVGETMAMVRASTVLAALIGVEFLWGFGMTSFETLTPPKLAETTGSTETAASLLGPVLTVAWIAMAGGAALTPRLTDRLGAPTTAMAVHVGQALAVVGLAASSGEAGVIAFFLVVMTTHGAANPVYQALLHEQADAAHRTTVVSTASMAAHPGGALGGIVLGTVADRTSVSAAMFVGAIALAGIVPLYVPALRQSRETPISTGS
jgi:MFS family permease